MAWSGSATIALALATGACSGDPAAPWAVAVAGFTNEFFARGDVLVLPVVDDAGTVTVRPYRLRLPGSNEDS